MYSFKTLLMMSAKSPRKNVECYPRRIIKTIAPSCITLVVLLIDYVMMHGSTNIKYLSVTKSRRIRREGHVACTVLTEMRTRFWQENLKV